MVQSLAKWKRLALKRYGFFPGKGLYTDMNAIRRDEDELDNLHSVYVDQWDWEKVILPENRNTDYLGKLKRDVSFVTTQELEDLYPDLTPKQRENAWVREHRTSFIMGIGGALRSGQRHDGRAPDYDDWDLNGDIFFYDDILDCAMEISSMGIRVDPESMDRQLRLAGCDDPCSCWAKRTSARSRLRSGTTGR